MIIDKKLLDDISSKAQTNERLRMNYNLHDSLDSKVQRLLNALEPGSVIPIHRHTQTDETYIVIRGQIEVVIYDDDCNEIDRIILNHKEGKYGFHITKNQWHSVNVLAKNTVIFEVKEGPYTPLTADNIMTLKS